MKNPLALYLAVFMFLSPLVFAAGKTRAEQASGHEVYRVTYYDLGALLGDERDGRNPGAQSIPLMIMENTSDIFLGEGMEFDSLAALGSSSPSGGVLSAEFNPTETIKILGSFGMAQAAPGGISFGQDGQSAWEANIGLAYNFFGNLSYQMNLGYMDPGDLFTERSSYTDAEQILMISNSISLSF